MPWKNQALEKPEMKFVIDYANGLGRLMTVEFEEAKKYNFEIIEINKLKEKEPEAAKPKSKAEKEKKETVKEKPKKKEAPTPKVQPQTPSKEETPIPKAQSLTSKEEAPKEKKSLFKKLTSSKKTITEEIT